MPRLLWRHSHTSYKAFKPQIHWYVVSKALLGNGLPAVKSHCSYMCHVIHNDGVMLKATVEGSTKKFTDFVAETAVLLVI